MPGLKCDYRNAKCVYSHAKSCRANAKNFRSFSCSHTTHCSHERTYVGGCVCTKAICLVIVFRNQVFNVVFRMKKVIKIWRNYLFDYILIDFMFYLCNLWFRQQTATIVQPFYGIAYDDVVTLLIADSSYYVSLSQPTFYSLVFMSFIILSVNDIQILI